MFECERSAQLVEIETDKIENKRQNDLTYLTFDYIENHKIAL